MVIVLIAVLLQVNPPSQGIAIPKAPSTATKQSTEQPPVSVPQIRAYGSNTTPSLELNAEPTHAQMELDIGTEKEAISTLKGQVQTLETLRLDPDRKDIDSLKELKTRITIWTYVISIVGGVVIGFVWKFNRIIWSELIKPRLQREILGPPPQALGSPPQTLGPPPNVTP
jgi:hypothetical protein